jgi:hypothetical protein
MLRCNCKTGPALPLGVNSTFLTAAVNSGAAPSRSWGLWTGSRSIKDPVDGLLVVGGYDRARIQRQLTNFSSSQQCATCLTVTNLTYIDDTGSSFLFANTSEVLEIGLNPYERSLELPQDVFDAFTRVSNGTFDPSLGLLVYSTKTPPTDNLSVSLLVDDQDNYTVTIPVAELFSFPRLFDHTGGYSIINDSIIIAEVDNLTDPKNIPV